MKNWLKLTVCLVLVIFGLQSCGGRSVSDIAGTYKLTHHSGKLMDMEVLEDGRVRFEPWLTNDIAYVTKVTDDIFTVDFKQDRTIYIDLGTEKGKKTIGWNVLVFDTNEHYIYFGFEDYNNRDIKDVEKSPFQ